MGSIIPGYEYDIFISYRQKDNKYDGWVTQFVDNLNRELESAFKEEVRVYFDINPHDGLLETHDVAASLEEKLKCLVFIPIISRTYCDPKSYAWDHEFKAFIEQASQDQFGLLISLPNGNVANRLLPVRINDLDISDIKLCESILGGVFRGVDFIYKEPGVNRPLRSNEDNPHDNLNHTIYRNQINKVALAVKDIIESMKASETYAKTKDEEIQVKERVKKIMPIIEVPAEQEINKREQEIQEERIIKGTDREFPLLRKSRLLVLSVAIIIAIFFISILILYHRSKVKWANEVAIPLIDKYISDGKYSEAYKLEQKAEKYIANEPNFKELASRITYKLTISSDPPGADVFVREYSDLQGKWKKLGKTPVDSVKLTAAYYLMRMEKKGYEDVIAVAVPRDTLNRKLFKVGTIPLGMVYVEGYYDWGTNVYFKKNHGFFIDRFEVTNKQFKEFIDNGGYKDSQYWKNDFIKNGKSLLWTEAVTEFTDKTGRPGPATWEAGDYPDGQDDYPVGGVSWYEAAAYAEYKGKSLPSSDHWASAAGFYAYPFLNFCSRISPMSNFNGKDSEPVGMNQGVTCFGVFDMAGNVREWCWNETKSGRVIRGGGWDDINYMYSQWSQLSPFDRSTKNGFRCVQYIDKEKIPESAFRHVKNNYDRDFLKEEPVSDKEFMIFKNQFLYDKKDLEARVEKRYESNKDWIIEKITFNAAYGNERVIAYLYLPKNTSPPFQTLILFPSTDVVTEKDLINYSGTNNYIDFVLKNGRAVIYPVYKGTFERNDGLKPEMTEPNLSHEYTDWLIKWVKDFSRSIDYLETRSDIDINKLGYYGGSWGGMMGGIIPAIEDRVKVYILYVGGFDLIEANSYPEVDAINYVTRIKSPILMLNGKYDPFFPYETTVIPFFNRLGTPEKDKRLCVYETDHFVPKSEMIKETLNWLDLYLGPVK